MKSLIIDGSNLLFRVYWIANSKPRYVNSNGNWTAPAYLFLKSLKSLQDKFKPEETWLCWDKKINYPSTNYRKQLAPETYKQNRDSDLANKVHEQYDLIEPWLETLGIKQMYPWNLEADDIISWLSKEKCISSVIVSVDKDLLQLIDGNTSFFDPIKKKLIDLENFEEELGVKVEEFVNYKALLGDKSDNVDGIDGYGEVKSKRLVTEGYEGIAKKLSNEDKEKFDKNIQIVNLLGSYNKEQGEVECYEKQYNELKNLKPNIKKFEIMCHESEFFSFIKALDSWKDSFTRTQSLLNLIHQL
jgi:DNA polymerase-1